MSEPAVFAVVRNGTARFFADRWASAMLRREVMWGPADFESWVMQFEPLEQWEPECDGGAVIDFDRQLLAWTSNTANYPVPRVLAVYRKMLAAAWPNFEIKHISGGNEALTKFLPKNGDTVSTDLVVPSDETPEDELISRVDTVDEAKRSGADDEPDENEEGVKTDSEEPRAWITIIDADGESQQRELEQLPLDLLKAKPQAILALAKLKPTAIPREAILSEGMWIKPSEKTAGIWGSPELMSTAKQYSQQWKSWKLMWMKRGYVDHCAVAGIDGMPMSTAEAVAKVVPLILSTQALDTEVMLGAIGGGLKKFANKAVGCLAFVLCLPLLIFGLISGNWTSVLISMGVTILVVFGIYRLLLFRFKRAVNRGLADSSAVKVKTTVAGPLDAAARRQRIDALLQRAALPRLSAVEPLFSGKTGLELLAE